MKSGGKKRRLIEWIYYRRPCPFTKAIKNTAKEAKASLTS